jgi:hypothetical protein
VRSPPWAHCSSPITTDEFRALRASVVQTRATMEATMTEHDVYDDDAAGTG